LLGFINYYKERKAKWIRDLQVILECTNELLSSSKLLFAMKQVTLFIFVAILISSCEVGKQSAAVSQGYANEDTHQGGCCKNAG
jgi:hypothetical protein